MNRTLDKPERSAEDGLTPRPLHDLIVEYPDSGRIYRWYGGHTVGIFRSDGAEVEAFEIYGPEGERPSLAEVSEAITEHERNHQ